jgi:L-ribulose-5-phosphate 4-epimerase
MASVDELKGQIVQAAAWLRESGVLSHSGHGNISARIDGERMVLTGASSLRAVSPELLAVVTLDGRVLEGQLNPSTAEVAAMHACIYRSRENVGAVIHTHSPAVTAYALANEPLPCAYEAVLRQGCYEAVPVSAWAPRGSDESVGNIVEQVRAHPAVPAVLLGNHGLLAFSADARRTADLVVALEEAAGMTRAAGSLGGARPFPPDAFQRSQERMRQFGTI